MRTLSGFADGDSGVVRRRQPEYTSASLRSRCGCVSGGFVMIFLENPVGIMNFVATVTVFQFDNAADTSCAGLAPLGRIPSAAAAPQPELPAPPRRVLCHAWHAPDSLH